MTFTTRSLLHSTFLERNLVRIILMMVLQSKLEKQNILFFAGPTNTASKIRTSAEMSTYGIACLQWTVRVVNNTIMRPKRLLSQIAANAESEP